MNERKYGSCNELFFRVGLFETNMVLPTVKTSIANRSEWNAGKVSNEVLAKCDLCYTFPCKNGGTCQPSGERDYECRCAPGYHGRLCESAIDACYGNPCRNSATCKVPCSNLRTFRTVLNS